MNRDLPFDRIRREWPARLRPWLGRLVPPVLTAGAGFVLAAGSVASLRPFGVALLAACSGAGMTAAALAGCLLGAPGPGFALLFALEAVARFFLSRYLSGDRRSPKEYAAACRLRLTGGDDPGCRPLFREGLLFRAAVAAGAGLATGFLTVSSALSPWSNLLSALLTAALAPLLTVGFCGITTDRGRADGLLPVGQVLLTGCLILSLRAWDGTWVAVSSVAAFATALWIGARDSASKGCVIGLFAGLAIRPMLSPVYAVGGLAAGLGKRLPPAAAVGIGTAAGLIFALWVGGSDAVLSLAPSLGAADLLLLASFRLFPPKPPRLMPAEALDADAAAALSARCSQLEEAVENLGASFRSVGEALGDVARHRRIPASWEADDMVDGVIRRVCGNGCGGECTAREKLAAALRQKGQVEVNDVADLTNCDRLGELIDGINEICARRGDRAAKNDGTEALADGYLSVAALLGETIRREEEALRYDGEATAALRRAFARLDFAAETVSVYGKRRRVVTARGIRLGVSSAGGDDLRQMASRVLGVPLSAPNYSIGESGVSLEMHSLPRMRAVVGRAGEAAESGVPSGDTLGWFESRDGYAYGLISDGMGTGHEAALTSRIASVFLERMLSSGAGLKTTLEMLHRFLRTGPGECSATVDLCELDLFTGEARFVKSGAAPSFVMRNGKLFRLESRTAPIGILRSLDAEMMHFSLRRGDVVVMISDGISSGFEDGLWLMEMLCREEEWLSDVNEMARKILSAAREHTAGDDASVVLIKVG